METATLKKTTAREQIKDIMLDVSWAKVAKRYFDQPPSWIYHKIDGMDGNGGFTEQEKRHFRAALCDLSERIRKAADGF